MALPPQAIEKLIHEPSHSQGAYRQLLLFSGALFGLALIIYAGLAFGYRAYLATSLQKIDKDIQSFSNSISQEDRAELQGFDSQLVNLRTLLAGHTANSPILGLLERTQQPNVYFTKLTSNTGTDQVTLTGAAKTLDDAARQAAALQEQPEVDRLDFNNAGAQSSGPWQFTITLHLKPSVFHGAVISAPAPVQPIQPTIPTSTPS